MVGSNVALVGAISVPSALTIIFLTFGVTSTVIVDSSQLSWLSFSHIVAITSTSPIPLAINSPVWESIVAISPPWPILQATL